MRHVDQLEREGPELQLLAVVEVGQRNLAQLVLLELGAPHRHRQRTPVDRRRVGRAVFLGTVATGPGNAVFTNHIDSTSPVGVWIPLTTGTFTAPAGSESLQVFGIAIFPQELVSGTGVFEDDLDLEPVNVPEPASLGLLAVGGVSLLLRRRRA